MVLLKRLLAKYKLYINHNVNVNDLELHKSNCVSNGRVIISTALNKMTNKQHHESKIEELPAAGVGGLFEF